MNKTEFITALAERMDVTKKEATTMTDAFLDTLGDGLATDGLVAFTNVFTMKAKDVEEREGRNPKTGETITIPAGRRPYCSFGRGLKEKINAPKKAATKKVAAKKATKKVVKKK